ncbi:MAG TPA: basic secretory protein-like protein [Chitinophaga sp.]|uniref:basic secretory protein-like protein n=1 Tax=Chitinophaga sp. TaxID=1869181 RepID=UPI002F93CF4E
MSKWLMGLPALLLPMLTVQAQNISKYDSRDKIKHGGYTLLVLNKDSTFNPEVKQKLEDVFFKVYPKLADTFNKKTLRKVTFIINPEYDGVAATNASSGEVNFSPEWFRKHPEDIDVVTHEVMHIVQNYPDDAGPGWLTEGIADYVRYAFGVDNAGANWKLPQYSSAQNYTQSYRTTARFLAWLEKKVKPGIVKVLDESMRNRKYTPQIWQTQTGKSLDELWSSYAQNPEL